jgi:hypothetical protein
MFLIGSDISILSCDLLHLLILAITYIWRLYTDKDSLCSKYNTSDENFHHFFNFFQPKRQQQIDIF